MNFALTIWDDSIVAFFWQRVFVDVVEERRLGVAWQLRQLLVLFV